MGRVVGFECVRCGRAWGLDIGGKAFAGCLDCAGEGQPANLSTVYDYAGFKPGEFIEHVGSRPRTMWRYMEFLPATSPQEVISLQEGCTPLVRLGKLEREYGIGRLYVKDESRNPTGSFKDRLASAAVTHALRAGATATTVSSTGNHGASSAAYSSRAGIQCFVLTSDSVPLTMRVLMQVYGGKLVLCRETADRCALIAWGVREKGWHPLGNWHSPPIGSNPYGVDGYKSIALEICEELGWEAPDVVVWPVAYGDGIYGTWKGFADAARLGVTASPPRMYAAEVHGSLGEALRSPGRNLSSGNAGSSSAFSIDTPRSTHQALKALVDSGGGAITIADEEMLVSQEHLGSQGIYAEMSSCISLAGVIRLAKQGVIGSSDTVVAVLTATGQRDPWVTRSRLPEVPVIGPDPAELTVALATAYGLRI